MAFDIVRCPTCRAEQGWSDACRRCKSDLRLLREVAEAYNRSRRDCLLQLQGGDIRAALRSARTCHSLRADGDSRRLLAIGSLHCGDWTTAATLARRVLRDEGKGSECESPS